LAAISDHWLSCSTTVRSTTVRGNTDDNVSRARSNIASTRAASRAWAEECRQLNVADVVSTQATAARHIVTETGRL